MAKTSRRFVQWRAMACNGVLTVRRARLLRAELLRLPDVLQREVEVVGAQALDAHPEPRDVRAGEEARRGAVRRHRLVRLVLRRLSTPVQGANA